MNFGFNESNERGWSTGVFKGFNRESNLDCRWAEMDVVEDFHRVLATTEYTLTQATQGTFGLSATIGNIGVGELDCNSTTATQGGNLQFLGQKVIPAAGLTWAIEARIRADDIATGPEFFFGLHDSDTAIISSSAMHSAASNDWVGFKSVTDDNVLLATSCDNTTESTAASIHTFADGVTSASNWVKLGLRGDRTGVDFFVNGVVKGRITSNLPSVGAILLPSFVCQSGGTTDPIIQIDAYRVAAAYLG